MTVQLKDLSYSVIQDNSSKWQSALSLPRATNPPKGEVCFWMAAGEHWPRPWDLQSWKAWLENLAPELENNYVPHLPNWIVNSRVNTKSKHFGIKVSGLQEVRRGEKRYTTCLWGQLPGLTQWVPWVHLHLSQGRSLQWLRLTIKGRKNLNPFI